MGQVVRLQNGATIAAPGGAVSGAQQSRRSARDRPGPSPIGDLPTGFGFGATGRRSVTSSEVCARREAVWGGADIAAAKAA
jgi:hypothetical protein